jgi:hypothetical protein
MRVCEEATRVLRLQLAACHTTPLACSSRGEATSLSPPCMHVCVNVCDSCICVSDELYLCVICGGGRESTGVEGRGVVGGDGLSLGCYCRAQQDVEHERRRHGACASSRPLLSPLSSLLSSLPLALCLSHPAASVHPMPLPSSFPQPCMRRFKCGFKGVNGGVKGRLLPATLVEARVLCASLSLDRPS